MPRLLYPEYIGHGFVQPLDLIWRFFISNQRGLFYLGPICWLLFCFIRLFIMKTTLHNFNLTVFYSVYNTIGIINSATPKTLKFIP